MVYSLNFHLNQEQYNSCTKATEEFPSFKKYKHSLTIIFFLWQLLRTSQRKQQEGQDVDIVTKQPGMMHCPRFQNNYNSSRTPYLAKLPKVAEGVTLRCTL